MRSLVMISLLASLLLPTVAAAQDGASIIVTAQRVDRDDYDEYYDDDQSAIGLTRKADHFVKPIYINSDSREKVTRDAEVTAMLRATIEMARERGIELVAGSYVLKPLTLTSLEDLSFGRGNRPDTTRVGIYARLPVGGKHDRVDEVDELIEAFIKDVPVTGRSYIETASSDLAINNPQQYRPAVVKAIADEARRYAAMFGGDYGVEVRGLDSELYFKQSSETEVFLYIEHSFVIKPK